MTKAFISSTYADLVTHRDAVVKALRKAHVEVLGMEDYGSTDMRPVQKCLEDVSKADIYIGVFAHRYGYVPSGASSHMSITEMEYRHAVRENKTCLIFLHDQNDIWPLPFVDEMNQQFEAAKCLRDLRLELTTNHVCSFFTTPDNLASLVVSSVGYYEQRKLEDESLSAISTGDIVLSDLRRVRSMLKQKQSSSQQLALVIREFEGVLQVSLILFIAAVIRSYEGAIVGDPPEYAKKVKPIKTLLSQNFRDPALPTLRKLATHCIHLVDAQAPDEVKSMKEHWLNPFHLASVGTFFENLEQLFPPDTGTPRFPEQAALQRSLVDFVIPRFGSYVSKLDSLQEGTSAWNRLTANAVEAGVKALETILEWVRPICDQVFSLQSVESVDSVKKTYQLVTRTYKGREITRETKEVAFEELENYEGDITELAVTKGAKAVRLRLEPFLTLKGDCLYFYRSTKASAYEYYCLSNGRPHLQSTNRKFSQSVFRVQKDANQALFWTEVLPTLNESNGVRSNIPSEGRVPFVGRKKQMQQIRKEILEIPNQNGIVYGVGGVGKTALMIQLSRELSDADDVLFPNIVWVSAKKNYYVPALGVVQPMSKPFESLEAAISAILSFFDLDELEGYSIKDKKQLLFELLREQCVLLILDNFETLSKSQQNAIIKFLEVEVKHELRETPKNFKAIITSRESIASGFHPISLSGLELKDAKQLMNSVCKHYSGAKQELSEEQKDKLHEATFGIPIVIKHCLGQIYEHGKGFTSVIQALPHIESQTLVDFSYTEILNLLKKEQSVLRILLLLDLIRTPLMKRQIADILALPEAAIAAKMPRLENYQCVRQSNEAIDEKYELNPEIRLLMKNVTLKHEPIALEIRQQIAKNFTLDKQMDYGSEELGIVVVFDDFVRNKQYLEAEKFMREELDKREHSTLLNFRFAKYLIGETGQIDRAIEILERIRESADNHPSILRLLVECYANLEIPNYARAAIYVRELESVKNPDDGLRTEIAEFYSRWSVATRRNNHFSPDPLDEIRRRQRYKELADCGLQWLKQIHNKTHHVYFLFAECYFSKWENREALTMIQRALAACKNDDLCRPSYVRLKAVIQEKIRSYDDIETSDSARSGRRVAATT